jgi:hypothetical protein
MDRIPPAKQFFSASPLYLEYELDSNNFYDALRIQYYGRPLDLYCVECGQESVFAFDSPLPSSACLPQERRDIESMIANNNAIVPPGMAEHVPISRADAFIRDDRTFSVKFRCTRDSSHFIAYFVRVKRKSLAKVGQTPSLADLKSHSSLTATNRISTCCCACC